MAPAPRRKFAHVPDGDARPGNIMLSRSMHQLRWQDEQLERGRRKLQTRTQLSLNRNTTSASKGKGSAVHRPGQEVAPISICSICKVDFRTRFQLVQRLKDPAAHAASNAPTRASSSEEDVLYTTGLSSQPGTSAATSAVPTRQLQPIPGNIHEVHAGRKKQRS